MAERFDLVVIGGGNAGYTWAIRASQLGMIAPQEIAMAVHAHPTLAEAVGEAAMAVDGQAINF